MPHHASKAAVMPVAHMLKGLSCSGNTSHQWGRTKLTALSNSIRPAHTGTSHVYQRDSHCTLRLPVGMVERAIHTAVSTTLKGDVMAGSAVTFNRNPGVDNPCRANTKPSDIKASDRKST